MQVSPHVKAVQIPETNPMHPQFTTIYLVGGDQALTIDSGADEERFRWMLRGYLAATEKAEIALCALTHFHFDHSSNLRWICEEFEASACISQDTADRLTEKQLPDEPTRGLSDGGYVDAGAGARLQVLHTPGHSPDSHCYYLEDEGVLFTGDTILGGTTTSVQDLSSYMESLSRLRSLPNLRVICPGHGPIIDNPRQLIDQYIEHRRERERQVIAALSDAEAQTSWQIMESIYTDLDPRLRRAADGNVRAHLSKLEKEGRLKVHAGKPRERSAQELAQAEAQERERLEVFRKADEQREQARRRALFMQENPPIQEWLEPPRFDLV
jgi:endoribonuclease LACTB2